MSKWQRKVCFAKNLEYDLEQVLFELFMWLAGLQLFDNIK